MKFDQSVFESYLYELQTHLFGEMSLSEIIEEINDNYRARRFIGIYLLKNRNTLHHYYAKRKELGIEQVVDTVISALFHEQEKKPIKQELIELLDISEDMIVTRIEGYPIREFQKDLNSFIMYWRKRAGDLAELKKFDSNCN